MDDERILVAGEAPRRKRGTTAYGCPRDFLDNRQVYVVISPRARGLSVGVNLNPDRQCNFDCAYCEVNRTQPAPASATVDMRAMADELADTIGFVRSGAIGTRSPFNLLPPELLELRHVAVSGDGEPTLCPQFAEAIESVVHVRAKIDGGFFKIVLITNGTGFEHPLVQKGIALLTNQDEVWAKLEAGTQSYMDNVNRSQIPLEKVVENIRQMARLRPVMIQSLFPSLSGRGPSEAEVLAYAERLKDLNDSGAQIPLVQIYSATRPTMNPDCGHLPLQALSAIARTVRRVSGLRAEVF